MYHQITPPVNAWYAAFPPKFSGAKAISVFRFRPFNITSSNIIASIILESITGISNLAALPWEGAVVLILISMVLTYIAGLIPARLAAKKDPVVALRSESSA